MTNSYEINIMELLGILRKNWIKLVIAGVIGAVIAAAYTVLMITPKYQSTAKMVIINKQQLNITNSDIQTSTQLINDCVEVLKSRDLMTQVADKLDWEMTSQELLAETTVTAPADTRVLHVTVTDPNPEHARKIAYCIYESASNIFVDMLDINAVNLIEEPIRASAPSSPSKTKNTLLGCLVGVMLVAGILIIKKLTNNRIFTVEDVENNLKLTLLAAIPDSMEGEDKKKRQKRRKAVLKDITKR